MNPEPRIENPEPRIRKNYTPPSLVIYGTVGRLTQGGSGSTTEQMMNGSKTRKPASERCVKENIVRIGDHPLGFGLYLFDYRPEHCAQWGHGRQFGVMIDEVEIVMPEAVCMYRDGYKRVDYGMLGISRSIN
jgi:hypothetical protein